MTLKIQNITTATSFADIESGQCFSDAQGNYLMRVCAVNPDVDLRSHSLDILDMGYAVGLTDIIAGQIFTIMHNANVTPITLSATEALS